MDLDTFKKSFLFEPTDDEIKRFLKKKNNMKEKHKGGAWELEKYKDNPAERPHGMSLSYASKKVKDLKSKHETAVKLWS